MVISYLKLPNEFITFVGEMETYLLRSSRKKSIWEIIDRPRGWQTFILSMNHISLISDENLNSIDGYDEMALGIDEDIREIINPVAKTCVIS
jgi:hypothetical protein